MYKYKKRNKPEKTTIFSNMQLPTHTTILIVIYSLQDQ